MSNIIRLGLTALSAILLLGCGKGETVLPASPSTVTVTITTKAPPTGVFVPLPTTTTQCVHNYTDWPVDKLLVTWNANAKNTLKVWTPGMQLCTNHVLIEPVTSLGKAWGQTRYNEGSATVILLAGDTPAKYREHVICHELGHALGLPHSNDPLSCMNIGPGKFERLPSAADLQTIGKTIWEWGSAAKNAALH